MIIQILKSLNSLFSQNVLFFFYPLVILLALSIVLFSTESAQAVPPVAVQGQLDLRDWDFEKNGSVKLSGEWIFYWKKLLTPKNFKSTTLPGMTGFFKVPGFWNDYDDHGKRLGGE